MNRMVTSKEELLKAAKEIVLTEGVEKLNIRHLAQKCDIAAGSVYNYFPSKTELLFSVIENFWEGVFRHDICHMEAASPFPDFFERVYLELGTQLVEFKAIFLSRLTLLKQEDISKAKSLEDTYFNHFRRGFRMALEQDSSIPAQTWTDTFTKEQFISFLFSNMLGILTQGEPDCCYLKEVITRLLYR